MMSKNKTFDWKFLVESRSADTANYLWNNYKLELSEEEFIKGWTSLKRRRHSPSKAKQQYKRLKEKFGFFTGEVS